MPSELSNAIRKNNLESVCSLIENGADVNNKVDNEAPLYTAIKEGYTKIAKLLIDVIFNKNPSEKKPDFIIEKELKELSDYWDEWIEKTKFLRDLLPENEIASLNSVQRKNLERLIIQELISKGVINLKQVLSLSAELSDEEQANLVSKKIQKLIANNTMTSEKALSLDFVQKLIADKEQRNLLHWAAGEDFKVGVNQLLEKGADNVNAVGDGKAPLHFFI